MSVQAISWVIEHSSHSGNTFVVLLMIANHARSDGTGAWPCIATLAKEARTSERTVHRAIEELEASGELLVAFKEGPKGTNYYDLAKMAPCQNEQGTLPKTTVDPAIAVAPDPSLTVLNRPSNNTEFENWQERQRLEQEKTEAKRSRKGRWTTRLDRREKTAPREFIDFAARRREAEEKAYKDQHELIDRVGRRYAAQVGGPARKETNGKGH